MIPQGDEVSVGANGFADTGIHMENIEDGDSSLAFHNTTIQFEPETETFSSAKKDADVEYVKNIVETIKADLDEIVSKFGQVEMKEDTTTGIVSYNYLFDNHTIVNTILDVANSVQAALGQVDSALSAQTTDEQQQEVVDNVVDNWTDNQIDATDDGVVDVVVVNDEVGQYEDDTEAPFYEDEENIINDILTRTHSLYRRR